MIKAVPIGFKECCDFINALHRHHSASVGDKFRVGAEVDGVLHGVVSVGRPVARRLDDGKTLEVLRCCTDGTRNVCSFLYSRAARIARELGYKKIITYILESESGDSLIAAGWHLEAENVGGGAGAFRQDRENTVNSYHSLTSGKRSIRQKRRKGTQRNYEMDD